MKKIYDKLLLALAVLLLAGGVFLYLQKSDTKASLGVPVQAQPADNPYDPVVISPSASEEASWPEASGNPSRPDWVYEVFTPPKIYIDAEGRFTQIPVDPSPEPPPFGIYLADLEREPYRLQFEGYIEEDSTDPSKTLLLMYNEETQEQIRVRPGNEKPSAEFKLLGFDIERVREGGSIEVVATATILDQRSGEEMVLKEGERLYKSGVTTTIRSEQDPSYIKELKKTPTEFEGPLGQYTLLEINLEESSVTVKKHVSTEGESEIRTLRTRSETQPVAPLEKTTSANDLNETIEVQKDAFDSLF